MSRPLYLVQRRNQESRDDYGMYPDGYENGVVIRAFALKSEAEAYAAKLEEEARKEVSPFTFCHHIEDDESTTLNEKSFIKQIRKLGLTLPQSKKQYGYTYYDWYGWWTGIVGNLTDEQREQIWTLFDRTKFYQVIECEMEE